MRILRVRLANFRGVEAHEVHFAPRGVTIVQGPNEAGKSSLAEAIDVIFDHLDSSTKREVRRLQPVHRDVGAEIEVDVETGPYAFTYFKRFHKKAETTLRIDRPTPENLTGREAHERATAMLAETIDVALWKALRIEQGTELQPANLSGQTRLSAALDAAAGGSARVGEREESLLQAVRAEYLEHFTEGGQERKGLRAAQEGVDGARQRLEELERRLTDLDADVQTSARLREEIGGLRKNDPELTGRVRERDAAVAQLERLEADAEAAEARASVAEERVTSAREAVERRELLVKDLADRTQARDKLLEQAGDEEAERSRVDRELDAAEKAAPKSQTARDAAEARLALRQRDRTFRHEELDLEQIRERVTRVDEARQEIVEAEAVLAGPKVTDATLQDLRKVDHDVDLAVARLETGGPRVHVQAHADLEAVVDGQALPMRAGEERDLVVGQLFNLGIPGQVDVAVRAGGTAQELRSALDEAQRTRADLLAAAGVTDLAAAAAVRDARREAERTMKERAKIIRGALRDLTEEQLRDKLPGLEDRVGRYLATRVAEPPPATDLAEAKLAEAEAEREQAGARDTYISAETALTQAREAARALADAEVNARANRRTAEELAHVAARTLNDARASVPDAALDKAHGALAREEPALRRQAKELAESLTKSSPDEKRTLALNARKSLDDARRQLREAENALSEVTGRLKVSGEEGLAETRDAAAATIGRLERSLAGLRRRAEAARLLHDTLQAARNEARAAYVLPLQERIERLGRLVYGPTLKVELGDDLSLLRRTLDGVTVAFDDLSGGTREQLGLLARLACAMIVAQDGGAPVILDDALGYTDAQRLESMGAALALAGESCQIIVLTCLPERYRHVGGAQVVRLG